MSTNATQTFHPVDLQGGRFFHLREHTAVATKIRPYIYRVNNLKIIHLKKWLVVLKRTD